MTFMQSFLKLMKEDIKHRGISLILSGYLFLMQIVNFALRNPFPKNEYRSLYVGPANISYFYISIIMVFACAYQGYDYLFSARKTNFYFSLPASKYGLFAAGQVNSILIFAIPCVLSKLISLQMAVSMGYTTYGVALPCVGFSILIALAGFCFLFQIIVLGMLLAGTWLTGIGMNLLFLYYPGFVVTQMIERYLYTFFETYISSLALGKLMDYMMPLTLYQNAMGAFSYQDTYEWEAAAALPYLCTMIIIVVVVFILNSALFLKRPGEAPGKAVSFEKVQTILRFVIVIPVSLTMGCLCMQASLSGRSKMWLAAGVCAGIFVTHGVMECIFRLDFKGMLHHKKQWLAEGLVCAAIAGFFLFYTGYDEKLPEYNRIEAMELSINGINGFPVISKADADSSGQWEMAEMELVYTGEDMKKLYQWLSESRADNQGEEGYASVTACFLLKDGKLIQRHYQIAGKEEFADFDSIYTTKAYKEKEFPILKVTDAGQKLFTWSNGLETYMLDITVEEKERLLGYYQKELLSLSLTDLKEGLAIGRLSLSSQNGITEKTGMLYASFVQTVGYLEELGIPAGKQIKDYEVTQIQIQHYVEANSVNLLGNRKKAMDSEQIVTDADEISKLKEILVYREYALEPLLYPIDESYRIMITWKGIRNHTIQMAECYLTKEYF